MFTEWSEDDVADMDVKELRAELNKRGLDVRGKPRVLRKRLNVAIRKQKEERLEEEAALEQQRMHEVFQEAAGSVYSVGRNNLGQLGLHDKKDRRKFTHVKDLWGGNVDKIFAGDAGVSFAIDYKQDVYGWGGGGVGPIGTLGPFKEKMPKSGPIRRAHVYRITQKRRSKWFAHPNYDRSHTHFHRCDSLCPQVCAPEACGLPRRRGACADRELGRSLCGRVGGRRLLHLGRQHLLPARAALDTRSLGPPPLLLVFGAGIGLRRRRLRRWRGPVCAGSPLAQT